VPRAHEKEGAYKGTKMIRRDLLMQKVKEKGPTKVKMKAMDPQKNFWLRKYLKMPRAYESPNPALVLLSQNTLAPFPPPSP
jgi:hypothetical protein